MAVVERWTLVEVPLKCNDNHVGMVAKFPESDAYVTNTRSVASLERVLGESARIWFGRV